MLKQLEQDWLGAYREGDADTMGKMLADDCMGRWADGSTQTTQEPLRAMQTGEEKHATNPHRHRGRGARCWITHTTPSTARASPCRGSTIPGGGTRRCAPAWRIWTT